MKIHDNTDEPKVNGYILGNQNQEIIRLKREVDKGDMIIGKLLNEGKAATEKNKQLRQLLKECKEYLSDVDTYFTKNADEATLLLTRIKEVLK